MSEQSDRAQDMVDRVQALMDAKRALREAPNTSTFGVGPAQSQRVVSGGEPSVEELLAVADWILNAPDREEPERTTQAEPEPSILLDNLLLNGVIGRDIACVNRDCGSPICQEKRAQGLVFDYKRVRELKEALARPFRGGPEQS